MTAAREKLEGPQRMASMVLLSITRSKESSGNLRSRTSMRRNFM